MRSIQPTLINFLQFKLFGLFENNAIISNKGIVHTTRQKCSICGDICKYNGNSNHGRHSLTLSTGTLLKKGQQYCPTCDKTIQVENSWLDNVIESINQFIVSQVLSLCFSMSEDEIVSHLKDTMSINISRSTIHNIITRSNKELESFEFEYEIKDIFYGYDEQHIKINGKKAFRIVFFDLKENKIIYEKVHYRFSKKILKQILKEVFGDKTPKGFVVDMKLEYPSAFRQVFGRKIKVQFCIFHLNKLIMKEYKDSLRVGKKVKWTLMDYYNLYALFNIFYNRNFELKFLKRLMRHYEDFNKKLDSDKIKFYVKKFNIKDKKNEAQKQMVLHRIEMKMIKAFRKILHDKKNQRKRQGKTLQSRLLNSAEEKLKKILHEVQYYPYKIQKRIIKIKKNFEYFVASGGDVLTNNKLEGFFGATLKQFRKKMRKSILSISAILKRKRLQQEGKSFFRKFTIFDIAHLFAVVIFFK